MERAIRLDPLNDNTRIELAALYIDTGRPERSRQLLVSALDLDPDNISIIAESARNQNILGNYTESVPALFEILEKDPGFIGYRQEVFCAYFDMGDLETAETQLRLIEAVSKDRAADERTLFCYVNQDEPCWHAATSRLLANRTGWFVQIWQSRMMLDESQLDDAIDVLLPLIDHYDSTGELYGNYQTRINLASLYHLSNNHDMRDQVLANVLSSLEFAIEHGWDSWVPFYYLAMADAARGDASEAILDLLQAYNRGFRALWFIDFDYAWNPIRDDPDFQLIIDRIKTTNSAMLKEIRAVSSSD